MKISIQVFICTVLMMMLPGLVTSQDDAAARKGKIAALPFKYVTNDPTLPTDQYGEQLQSEAAIVLREEAKGLQVQDAMTTNTLLLRNEITAENIATFLPGEIAQALGVQYVVFGTYNISNKGTVSTGSAVTTYDNKEKKEYDEDKTEKKTKGSEVTTTTTSSYVNYDARMDINIYDDSGQNVFSKSHKPFSADPAEYTATLRYILRRAPWGKKAGK